MFNITKDDYDESIEDIMKSVSKLLSETGEEYVIDNKDNKDASKGKKSVD